VLRELGTSVPEAEAIKRARQAAEHEWGHKIRQAKKAAENSEAAAKEAVERAERELREAEEARRKAKGDVDGASGIARGILEFLLELFLPMDLMKCVVRLLGLAVGAAVAQAGDGGTMRGVMVASTGVPLEDEVVVLAREGRPIAFTSTETNGYFEFEDLSPGEYQLVAGTDRIYMKRISFSADNAHVVFQALGGAPVSVQVLDAGGEPFSGATVMLAEIEDGAVRMVTLGETDHTGCTACPLTSRYAGYVLVAAIESEAGYCLLPPIFVPAYDPCDCHTFTVPAGGLSGRLVTATNSEPPNETVVTFYGRRGDAIAEKIEDMAGARAVSGLSGAFSCLLADGEYLMVASGPGYHSHATPVTVSGKLAQLHRPVGLRLAESTGNVRLRVLDPFGQPSGAYVVVVGPDGAPYGRRAFADARGEVEIASLPAGSYKLQVQGGVPGQVAFVDVTVTPECQPAIEVQLRAG
jgi:hypothetical protein